MPGLAIFSFVSDTKYRKLLENDYSEICKGIDHDCYKSSTTLSGSLIEALLTDFLLDKGVLRVPEGNGKLADVESAGLSNIITYCRNNNLVSTRGYYLLEAIRDFRNYIHPAKAIRSKIEITKEDAILYKSTLDIIISELSKKRQIELGSTAEQLLEFMLHDVHGVELFANMVKKANNEGERLKYLLEIAPAKILTYFIEYNSNFDEMGPRFNSYEEAQYVDDLKKRIEDITDSFHICFAESTRETKIEASRKMIEKIRYGSHDEKLIYISLFENEYIDLLDELDKDFLIDYMLANSMSLPEKLLIKVLVGIPRAANEEQRRRIFNSSIHSVKNRGFSNMSDAVANFLGTVKSMAPAEYARYVSLLSDLIVNNSDLEIIKFNNLIAEILSKLNEPVPMYIPF